MMFIREEIKDKFFLFRNYFKNKAYANYIQAIYWFERNPPLKGYFLNCNAHKYVNFIYDHALIFMSKIICLGGNYNK